VSYTVLMNELDMECLYIPIRQSHSLQTSDLRKCKILNNRQRSSYVLHPFEVSCYERRECVVAINIETSRLLMTAPDNFGLLMGAIICCKIL